jgi:hypothetical protein
VQCPLPTTSSGCACTPAAWHSSRPARPNCSRANLKASMSAELHHIVPCHGMGTSRVSRGTHDVEGRPSASMQRILLARL